MRKISFQLISGFFILSLFFGCATSDYQKVTYAALSSNPVQSFQNLAANQGVKYVANPNQAVSDLKSIQLDFKKIVAALVEAAGVKWGNDNVVQPSTTQYVKYTQDYLSRAEVDFDKGVIRVETVDEKNPKASLKQAIVTTILTPEDPRLVDLYSAAEVNFSGKPYLSGLVKDHDDKVVLYPWRANRYADWLVQREMKTSTINTDSGTKKVYAVSFAMVQNKDEIQGVKYSDIVRKYARKYNLEDSLVLAIIKTESSFNPYAVSSIPAYGLMQIVPTSAGADAYQALHGKSGKPTKNTLFNPDQNILYGTTYLDILFNRYLKSVSHPTSKEYCVIGAYNTGSGNVLKTFSGNRQTAVQKINQLKPDAVYWKLKTQLPYDETRRYLEKVTTAKKEFVSL